MHKDLQDYIFEDREKEKRHLADELLNESPQFFSEEQEMENLLIQAHESLDISAKVLDTIHQLDKNKNSELSVNVLGTIKSNKRKRIVIWSISAMAAVLVLSFILINLGGGSYFKITVSSNDENLIIENPDGSREIKKNSSVIGAAIIKYPKGVVVNSSEKSVYRFIDSKEEFLTVEEGELDISVESRKGKAPLYFKMPHAIVKVVGTSFILHCNNKVSKVMVKEGTVEFLSNRGTIKVAAGETGSSDDFESSEILAEPESKIKLSFESLQEGVNYHGFPELVQGRLGKCLKLDGTTGGTVFRGKNLKEESIAFWLKYAGDNSKGQSVLGQHDKMGSFNGFHIYLQKDKLFLQVKSQKETQDHSIIWPKVKWQHLVFTRSNKGDYSLFVNSVKVFAGSLSYKYNNENLSIGISSDSYWLPFEGLIDELRIFDRVLSDSDVKNLYRQK